VVPDLSRSSSLSQAAPWRPGTGSIPLMPRLPSRSGHAVPSSPLSFSSQVMGREGDRGAQKQCYHLLCSEVKQTGRTHSVFPGCNFKETGRGVEQVSGDHAFPDGASRGQMSSGTPGQPGEEETDESKGRKGLLPYLSSWSCTTNTELPQALLLSGSGLQDSVLVMNGSFWGLRMTDWALLPLQGTGCVCVCVCVRTRMTEHTEIGVSCTLDP
jgi:hypothetical protein